MSWQDLLMTAANIGFFIALLPLFFTTVFGVDLKAIRMGLIVTAFGNVIFRILMAIAVIDLGAKVGGALILLNAVMWLSIGIALITVLLRQRRAS